MKKHHTIILLWFIVSIYGAAIAFSATYINTITIGGNPYGKLTFQLIIIAVVGFAGILVFFRQKKINIYQIMKRYSRLAMSFSIGTLIIVILLGNSAERSGARMVIPLGVIDFQPLELFKIVILLFFAYEFSNIKPTETLIDSLKKLILPAIGIILLMAQPDFGGAMICLIVLFFMMIINGQHLKYIGRVSLGGIGLAIVGFQFLQDYQKQRIFMWLNPFNDAKNSGYQLINAYIAISNGGLLGSGYMNGIQKAGYLTQAGSDMIFGTICEELGLLGAFFTIGILFAIAMVAISIGNTAHERFGMLYCYGIAMLILTQTFINIGGVSGVIPMTGVTLPFISTGINSYLLLTLGIFLTVPISKASIKEKKRERKATNFKG